MGKFDAYKINLKGVQPDVQEFKYTLDNLFFANIDSPEVEKGKVRALVSVRKKSQMYEFTFQIDGIVQIPCDRCLDDMELPVSSTDKFLVKFGREFAEESDNIVVIPEDEGEINIAWFLFEFIVLNVPIKHVHGPGKCNKAMVGKLKKHVKRDPEEEEDLGDEDTGIDESGSESWEIDPRWNELKKIIDNN
ncbi:MAG: DUF177 domain-containing protein [Bacteroides sp.]|nr:DUF177 domain-containing protein [Bacteroides sp.]